MKLVIVFQDEAASQQTIEFKERPLGFTLKNEWPIAIKCINSDACQNIKDQLREGMRLVMVNDTHVDGAYHDHGEFIKGFKLALRPLPRKIGATRNSLPEDC